MVKKIHHVMAINLSLGPKEDQSFLSNTVLFPHYLAATTLFYNVKKVIVSSTFSSQQAIYSPKDDLS